LANLRHPSKFQRVSRLGFVTKALNGSQPNFERCLAVSCAGTLYIHFRGLLPRNGILPGAKFTLRPSLALYILAALLHVTRIMASAKLCGVEQTAPPVLGWAAITLWALAHILVLCFLWSPYVIGQTIIFLPCGSFLLLFSSPNISGRRLDVYHTSTHDVALVRI